MTLDLTHVGIGAHPADPTSPPPRWGDVPASAHTIIKANRAWHAVEHVPYAFGASRTDVARLRGVGLVIASSIYGWDAIAENDQALLRDTAHDDSAGALIAVLADMRLDTPAMRTEVHGIARLFELELAAARGSDDPATLWSELSRVRSADIRLQMRAAGSLLGVECDGAVRALSPLLEILEIIDDFASYDADVAAGSFNTYAFVRTWCSGADAQRTISAFVDERLARFREVADSLTRDEQRQLTVMMLRPRSEAQARFARTIAALPTGVARPLRERWMLTPLARQVHQTWSVPFFVADAWR